MAIDARNLDTATPVNIGAKPIAYRDRVSTDIESFYRFRLRKLSSFQLNLKGMSANADVELVQDRNGNQRIDLGEVIASSRATDRQKEAIGIEGLAAGTYFVRVFPRAGATQYRLTLSAKPTSQVSFAYEIVDRTNAFRQTKGLLPLAVNTQLSSAAQKYAQQMAIDDNWSHTGADGSSPWERITAAGYSYSQAAENLAAGHTTPASTMQGWINSPGHRTNLLAYQVQEIGVGYYFSANDPGKFTFNSYWSQSMATPTGVQVAPNVPEGGDG